MEINPNHPVTAEVRDQWHKLVAILMVHFGIKEFVITEGIINAMPRDLAVVFDSRKLRGDAVLRLVSMKDAMDMAKKEGGLPV
jgi:hypothetical protein